MKRPEGEATRCTSFEGTRRIASGTLTDVALATKTVVDRGARGPVLVFDDETSEPIELDLRGSEAEVRRRLRAAEPAAAPDAAAAPVEKRGPGRPRLGVVAREVTLLPRHWEWLAAQPGGASV